MDEAQAKHPRGRPPKTEVDPAIAQAICENLEAGMPLELAAEAEGVPSTTAYRWRDGFPDFMGMIARAKAQGAKKMSKAVLEGGKGSSMNAWMLERRYREHYGPPTKEYAEPTEVKIIVEGGLPRRSSQAK